MQRITDASQRLFRNSAAIGWLAEKYGWSFLSIVDANIGLEGDRFLFPSQELDGEWRFTTRQWTGEGPKYKHELPAMGVYLPRVDCERAYLCEGHADTVTARFELGLPAMGLVGTATVGTALPHIEKLREITIVMDADPAGWKAIGNIYNAVWKIDTLKTSVAFLIPPERLSAMKAMWGTAEFQAEYEGYGHDLTDYTVKYGPRAALDMLENPFSGLPIHKMFYQAPREKPKIFFKTSVNFYALAKGIECASSRCPCQLIANRGWGLTHCPSHSDTTPSLSLKHHQGVTLVHCFGGCDQNLVITALKERGLWGSERNAHARGAGGGTGGHLSNTLNWGARPAGNGGRPN